MSIQELIDRYIERDSLRRGVEEARLVGFGVPVWALVGHMRATGGDASRLATDYELPIEAVSAALAYYQLHRNAIDARVAANAA